MVLYVKLGGCHEASCCVWFTWTRLEISMGNIEMGNRRRLNKEMDTNALFASKIFSDDIIINVANDTKDTC